MRRLAANLNLQRSGNIAVRHARARIAARATPIIMTIEKPANLPKGHRQMIR